MESGSHMMSHCYSAFIKTYFLPLDELSIAIAVTLPAEIS